MARIGTKTLGLAEGRTVVFYDTRGRGLSTMVRDPGLLGMEHEIADTVIAEAIEDDASLVPDAEVVVVENAGHMGFVEHPERYVEIVGAYLDDLP